MELASLSKLAEYGIFWLRNGGEWFFREFRDLTEKSKILENDHFLTKFNSKSEVLDCERHSNERHKNTDDKLHIKPEMLKI